MIETTRKPEVHDQVLVEAEIDERVVAFRAVVVNTTATALWLGLVKPDPRLERLAPGDSLALTFRRDDGGLVAESTFLGHLGAGKGRLFSVQMPAEIRLTQRRTHLRLDAECAVEYTVVESDSTEMGIGGEGVTRNIGAGGLQFVIGAPLPETVAVGDELEFYLAVGQDSVMAEGEVIRVEDATDLGPDWRPLAAADPPRPPRTMVAVRFTSISDGAQDLIVRHIFALQRMRREGPKKGL
jgi:c-di-GMP-binding flagellar brake protein YcgR